jgi:hypothetical protein
MNKILSIVLIALLLIVTVALVSCGEEPVVCTEHQFEETVFESCTEKGYTKHNCTVCGYSYKDNYNEAHNYIEYEVVEPTCVSEGYTELHCQNEKCKSIIRVNIKPINYDNHCGINEEHNQYVYPTCTEFGYTVETCEACGVQRQKDYVAPQHAWSVAVTAPVVCGDYGIERKTCLSCGFVEETINTNPAHILTNKTVYLPDEDGKMVYFCDCRAHYEYADNEYNDILRYELVEPENGEKYYVVKGLKDGVTKAQLQYILIPATVNNVPVREIAASAFMGVEGLETVVISGSVVKIGTCAFSECVGVTTKDVITFIYEGTLTEWNKVEKVEGWTYGTRYYFIKCDDGQLDK